MKVHFFGAAGCVTGSMHLVEANGTRILLDCGLYQGRRAEANQRNRDFGFDPASIDGVVLSHAHIDHTGNLPGLVARGFEGLIYATDATRDLSAVMLADSAHIQVNDAKWFNRHARKWKASRIEPLYTPRDAMKTVGRFVTVGYEIPLRIADGVEITFRDAAHVLGSSSIVMTVQEGGGTPTRLVFSGDVGRSVTPLLDDPVPAWDADVLIMESTYGNRTHEPYASTASVFADAINRTVERGGKILIPSFALERAQEVIFTIRELREAGRIPEIPMFVDSPLTADITQVFRLHPEAFDADVSDLYVKKKSPFFFPGLRYIRLTDESKALNDRDEPMIILAGNGMCEAGRILHHLRNNIEDPRTTILFVGYQAAHTLGRRILERTPEVKIFGRPHRLRASVVAINGLSGHADRQGLLEFAAPSATSCRHAFLVHGEADQSEPLAEAMRDQGFSRVTVARRGQSFDV